MSDRPRVSIVMPIRNEESFVERSLGAVLSQDYPADLIEVLVVDGASTDATPEIVRQMAARSRISVRLLHNAGRTVPIGLNLGIAEASGDVIVRVDGHCVIADDYVSRCVEVLGRTDAACVGGPMETVGETALARTISAAQSSRFGVGGVAFRVGRETPGPVDTVPFGAYRRDVFDRLGGFDVELVRNQDDDFNYRLGKAGETVWLDPSIRSRYFSRAAFRHLWRQYFGYGFYKVRVLQKCGLTSLRHLVPAVFVAGLVGSVGIASYARRPLWIIVVAGPYALVNGVASVLVGSRRSVSIPSLWVAYAIVHVAYGVGFLAGLWRWRSGFFRRAQLDRSSPDTTRRT